MPQSIQQQAKLRKALLDICCGYSRGAFNKRPFFVRHIGNKEQRYFDELFIQKIEEAQTDGLLSEEQMLLELKNQGLWTAKDEKEVAKIKTYLENLNRTKNATVQMSLKEKISETIAKQQAALSMLESKKVSLLGMTSEIYANKVLNEEFVYKNTFQDKLLSIPFFSEDEFEYLGEKDLNSFVESYNEALSHCSESNIKLLAIQDWFTSSFSLSDNPVDYFGQPIKDFTFYQIKLATWAKYFISVMSTTDMSKIPDKYKEDPDKFIDFVKASEQSKKQMEKMSKHDMVFAGAKNQDDLDAMGLQINPERDFKEGSSIMDYVKKYGK